MVELKKVVRRGEFAYAVERKGKLPENAKEMKLILHMIRKERYDCWNELKIYDFGSNEEAFVVIDGNYLRVPDPEEKYYLYFPVTEDGQKEWRYVKIDKSTSMKGFLNWDEVRDKISYRDGIYDIVHITEEGKKLLGLPEFRIGEVEFLCEQDVLRKRVIEDENAHILLFEDTTVSKIDDNLCLLKPCESLNVIIIKHREGFIIFPINKTGFYNAEISYKLVDFVQIFEIKKGDMDNIVLKEYSPDRTVRLIPIN